MTSTPLAPRSDSTPTHKDQREAWPCHSGLSPCLSLSSVFLSVSIYHPLPRGGGWRLGPSPLLMSPVRHMTMWSVGGGWGRHTNLLSHKQHFRWKKKSPFTSLMDGVLIIIMTFILFLINSFSADSSFSVVCRIRGSRSISAFIFYFYFGQFSYDCFNFFFISIWCYVSFLLSCIIYFFPLISEKVNRGLQGFFKHISHVVCPEISCSRTMYCMWTGG